MANILQTRKPFAASGERLLLTVLFQYLKNSTHPIDYYKVSDILAIQLTNSRTATMLGYSCTSYLVCYD